jgi:hypothetical protein
MTSISRGALGALFAIAALAFLPIPAAADMDMGFRAFLPNGGISSTVPANGDLNPYGVAVIPLGFPSGGAVNPGDVLVSNFNDSSNAQGTGTTIISFTPGGPVAPLTTPGNSGAANVFFTSSAIGLSTALGV